MVTLRMLWIHRCCCCVAVDSGCYPAYLVYKARNNIRVLMLLLTFAGHGLVVMLVVLLVVFLIVSDYII